MGIEWVDFMSVVSQSINEAAALKVVENPQRFKERLACAKLARCNRTLVIIISEEVKNPLQTAWECLAHSSQVFCND